MDNEFLDNQQVPENNQESESFQNDGFDDIVILNPKKDRKFSDVMTMQCILCILLVIALLILNITIPKYSEMIISEYSAESSAESSLNQSLLILVEKISTFLNSAPNDRV